MNCQWDKLQDDIAQVRGEGGGFPECENVATHVIKPEANVFPTLAEQEYHLCDYCFACWEN